MREIYVGNLTFQVVPEELRKLFEPYGKVNRVSVPRDSATLRSRGFAFVEMQDDAEAERAIRELNGSTLGGRNIVVNEAPQTPKRPATTKRWRTPLRPQLNPPRVPPAQILSTQMCISLHCRVPAQLPTGTLVLPANRW